MSNASDVTAAILVIGDEILSGRTKDKNIGYIAEYLDRIGIRVREVRVVPDEEEPIIAALNALRQSYDYVFTTGGIGPTHDDITAECVAKALGVGIDHDPRAVDILKQRYQPEELNEARLRMARIPHGADLIVNAITKAPGFMLENVIVMAGVPAIMQNMLDAVTPQLRTGVIMTSRSLETALKEGDYAAMLGDLARQYPQVMMGSYPSLTDQGFRSRIVMRSTDAALLAEAVEELHRRLGELKI